VRAAHRQIVEDEDVAVLREEEGAYAVDFGCGNEALSVEIAAGADE
jgi:precorrin-6B methylase 2